MKVWLGARVAGPTCISDTPPPKECPPVWKGFGPVSGALSSIQLSDPLFPGPRQPQQDHSGHQGEGQAEALGAPAQQGSVRQHLTP